MTVAAFESNSENGRRSVAITDREIVIHRRALLASFERRIPMHAIESVSIESGPTRWALWLAGFLAWSAFLTASTGLALADYMNANKGFAFGVMAAGLFISAVLVLVFGRPTRLAVRTASGQTHDLMFVSALGQKRVDLAVDAITRALPRPHGEPTID